MRLIRSRVTNGTSTVSARENKDNNVNRTMCEQQRRALTRNRQAEGRGGGTAGK